MVIWANITTEAGNELMQYMDNYIECEEKAWPELRSFCINITKPTDGMHIIYDNGKFYA